MNWTKVTTTGRKDVAQRHQAAISFKDSIWFVFAAELPTQAHGVFEYDCNTSTWTSNFPFPFATEGYPPLSARKYKEDTIVIVDENRTVIFWFNVITKQFSELHHLSSNLNYSSSVIVVGDYIHIHREPLACNQETTIFSMRDCSVKSFRQKVESEFTANVTVTRWIWPESAEDNERCMLLIAGFGRIHSNKCIAVDITRVVSQYAAKEQYYKFGGWTDVDRSKPRINHSFYVGTLANRNAAHPIQWTATPKYALPLAIQQRDVALQCGSTILLFVNNHDGANDVIWMLDVADEVNGEWIQCPIRCPVKYAFQTVLDQQKVVHVFSHKNFSAECTREHYCIPLDTLFSNVRSNCSRNYESSRRHEQIARRTRTLA